MATKKPTEPTEFPVSLEEFASGLPKGQIESRQAFAALMRKEGTTGRKPRDEWARLYELFQKQPTATPWAEWISQNKGGK